MSKDELIALLNTLDIEEIQNFKIEYYSEWQKNKKNRIWKIRVSTQSYLLFYYGKKVEIWKKH